MTVNVEIPVVKYIGNGVTTTFTFKWSSGDSNEIYVTLDNEPLEEGVEYELEDYTGDFGGSIVFGTAPVSDAQVIIYRETPVTQQVDYEAFEPFPADTHEFQMDKDTRILQEMISGGRVVGGRVDLTAIHEEQRVVIDNSSGTDAVIQPWTTDGLLSGVMMGEVVEFDSTSKPLDGTTTSKPNGFLWWELGAPVQGVGDANITLFTPALNIEITTLEPVLAQAQFIFNALTGEIQYGDEPGGNWTEEHALTMPTATGQYLMGLFIQSGSAFEYANSPVETWIDVYTLVGTPNEYAGWYVTDPGTTNEVIAHFAIAPDAGGGVPDTDFMITRAIRLKAIQNSA